MRNLLRVGGVAIASVLAVALMSPVIAADDVTIGEFVQRLARAKGLSATDSAVAAEALAKSGVRLPGNLNFGKRLTEGDVAMIARTAGVNVRTGEPDAGFDGEQVDRFFSSFAGDLDNVVERPGGGDNRGQDWGDWDDPFGGVDADGDGMNDGRDGKAGKAGKGKDPGERTPTDPD